MCAPFAEDMLSDKSIHSKGSHAGQETRQKIREASEESANGRHYGRHSHDSLLSEDLSTRLLEPVVHKHHRRPRSLKVKPVHKEQGRMINLWKFDTYYVSRGNKIIAPEIGRSKVDR